MAHWKFIASSSDREFRGLEKILFSSHRHYAVTGGGDPIYFFLTREDILQAYIAFVVDGKSASSPRFAPYGGFGVKTSIPLDKLSGFMEKCIKSLEERGVEKVEIKSFPEGLDGYPVVMANHLLMEMGFRVTRSELHSIIDLNGSWKEGFPASYKNKLQRCESFNFSWEPPDKAREVFEFILECRENKGQSFSMDFPVFNRHVRELPDHFFMSSLRDGGRLVAAMVCVKVDSKVIYDFAHAHHPDYNALSPVIRLIVEASGYFQGEGYQFLDLGSSSLPSGPNYSLQQFKQNLGGQFYRKDFFERII